ncbi:MAG: hypothetical protein JWO11_495 [Nocardioides sp.]|nr:hypothetical protein [Nocardioides sp.]
MPQTPGRALDDASARALVQASRLFDEDWYAAQCGESFGSRAEAVAHWVAGPDPEASPHPLFEPRWLYPRARWQRLAPDPLSYYLSRPGEQDHAPHPLVDLEQTGPLEDWLAAHPPGELLGPDLPRVPVADVTVVVLVGDLVRGVHWIRHLATRSPEVTGAIRAPGTAAARILAAVARGLPTIRVQHGEAPPASPVTVTVQPTVNPPRWTWLPDLVAALDRPGVAAAQPLLLNPDFTVAAAGVSYTSAGATPLLAGHPVADAERLAHLPLPAPWPGVLAVGPVSQGDTVLVPSSRLIQPHPGPGPDDPVPPGAPDRTAAAWRAAGFEGPGGRALTVREGRPALRWALDIAAPAAARGNRWGDFHFAGSLAAALDRLGQWVSVDHPQTRDRATRELDDVVVTIRGLRPVEPRPGTTNLLWVISHPEDVTREEAAAYDAVFAASTTWAADHSRDWGFPVTPLLQCTDPTRFHPGLADPDSGPRVLFVANARGLLRPSIEAALEVGTPVSVYGAGWDEWLPAGAVTVAGNAVANDELGALYASAGLVLNDHWQDMRAAGFISNRIFDVLATGARLLTDDVAGLRDVFGSAAPTWHSADDFRALTTGHFEDRYPDAATRSALAERVVTEHSFDARARELLDAALRLRRAP